MRIDDAAIHVTDTGSEYVATLTAMGAQWTDQAVCSVAEAISRAEREAREAERRLWSEARPASLGNPLVYVMPTGRAITSAAARHVNDAARVLSLSKLSAR